MVEKKEGKRLKRPKIIAVCGKGGVGKTSISAMITKVLMQQSQKRILAIDADPAVGLALSLGLPVTQTIDDIRNALIHDIRAGTNSDQREMLNRLDYEVLRALIEHRNLAFLAIGRPETEGCYCQVNQLLKEIIISLSQGFDYVIIDGEAGIEQVNRRVMTAVTHLLLVSDLSLKGINVCKTLKQVALTAIKYKAHALILNRVRQQDRSTLPSISSDLNPIGIVPECEQIRRFDRKGQSILSLSDGTALSAVQGCLQAMGL